MKSLIATSLAALTAATCVIKSRRKLMIHAKEIPTVDAERFKLEQVQIVFRHGARAPISHLKCMPNIEYGEEMLSHEQKTFIPYKLVDETGKTLDFDQLKGASSKYLGLLSRRGADQLYELGKRFSSHYGSELGMFAPGEYDASEIDVSSTKMRRTVESARSFLSGLYHERNRIDSEVQIPINVHSPPHDEVIAPSFKTCKYLNVMSAIAWEHPDVVDGVKEKTEKLMKLMGMEGESGESDFHIVIVRDFLHSHQFHHCLPSQFASAEIMKTAEEGAVKVMDHVFCGNEGGISDRVLKLSIGRFVRLLLDDMNDFVQEGKKSRKIRIYSGHDTTIIPLLNVLQIYNQVASNSDTTWPPFASNVIFELYRDVITQQRYVRVVYNWEVVSLPRQSRHDGYDDNSMMSLSDFTNLVSSFAITNDQYQQDCAAL